MVNDSDSGQTVLIIHYMTVTIIIDRFTAIIDVIHIKIYVCIQPLFIPTRQIFKGLNGYWSGFYA